MKKSTAKIVSLFLFFIFALLGFSGFSQEMAKSKPCANLSRPIPLRIVERYIDNYNALVQSDPDNALSQIYLTKKELLCLSKLSNDTVKFISAATVKIVDSMFIIVEIRTKKDT